MNGRIQHHTMNSKHNSAVTRPGYGPAYCEQPFNLPSSCRHCLLQSLLARCHLKSNRLAPPPLSQYKPKRLSFQNNTRVMYVCVPVPASQDTTTTTTQHLSRATFPSRGSRSLNRFLISSKSEPRSLITKPHLGKESATLAHRGEPFWYKCMMSFTFVIS